MTAGASDQSAGLLEAHAHRALGGRRWVRWARAVFNPESDTCGARVMGKMEETEPLARPGSSLEMQIRKGTLSQDF